MELNKRFEDPRFIFLLDGMGGLTTFFMYFAVLPNVDSLFHLSHVTMQKFSMFGLAYAIYSLGCLKFAGPKPFRFLGLIAAANLLFCGLSIGALVQQYEVLSRLDVAYLIGEKFTILFLVFFELRLFLSSFKNARD